MRLIEDKMNKELKQDLLRRVEDMEHFNTRKEIQYTRLERLMETSKAHEVRIESAMDLIEQVKAMTAEKCDVEESMKANNILCLMM